MQDRGGRAGVWLSESGLWLTERRGQLLRRRIRLGVWSPVERKKTQDFSIGVRNLDWPVEIFLRRGERGQTSSLRWPPRGDMQQFALQVGLTCAGFTTALLYLAERN